MTSNSLFVININYYRNGQSYHSVTHWVESPVDLYTKRSAADFCIKFAPYDWQLNDIATFTLKEAGKFGFKMFREFRMFTWGGELDLGDTVEEEPE